MVVAILSLSTPSPIFSQSGGECVMVEWSKNYGGSQSEVANDVIQTTDGGFLAVGFSRSNNNMVTQNKGKSDYWIVKVDSLGELEWESSFGGSENDEASGVVQTPDGGYLVAGGAVSSDGDVIGNNGTNTEDVWVLKLSAVGAMEWSRTYGGSQNERAESIENTNDGNYILAGYSESSNGDVGVNKGDFDYWVLKIDGNGNLLWENSFGGSLSDWGFDAKPTSDGGYLVAGSSFSNNGDVSSNIGFYDYWIIKLNANGLALWEKSYGGTLEERAYALDITPDDGAVIVGTTNSSDFDVLGNNGSYDYWVIRIEANGDLQWARAYGGASEDRAYGVTLLDDGHALAVGFTNSSNGDISGNYGSADAWMTNIAPDGSLVWEKNLGGTRADRLNDILQLGNGGFVAAGFSASNDFDLPDNFGERDLWIISLTPDSLMINIGNDTTLCFNDNLLLELQMDDVTYNWSNGSTDPFITVTEEGEYWLEVDLFGCLARDTINVDYLTESSISLGNDTILCEDETLLYTFNEPGAEYVWRDGSTDSTFLVNVPGVYWVTIIKDGCEQKDTVEIDYTEIDLDLEEEAFICEGEGSLIEVENPQATYLWQDNSTDPFYTITAPGIYWVEITVGGCSKADTMVVDYQDGPDSIFAFTSFVCEDEGVWFDASYPGATYKWQDGSTEPLYKAVVEGEYSVEVNINNCIFKEKTTLKACERCLFIPNGFSPNGDGINDVFFTIPTCELVNYHQMVFDRWGNNVFESIDPNEHWDGMYNDQKAELATYVYLILYDINDNGNLIPQRRTGSVTLIR